MPLWGWSRNLAAVLRNPTMTLAERQRLFIWEWISMMMVSTPVPRMCRWQLFLGPPALAAAAVLKERLPPLELDCPEQPEVLQLTRCTKSLI
jgi:hypothetical protein